MKIFSALLALGFSTSITSGYVLTLFSEAGCGGAQKGINVWDNTCSRPQFSEEFGAEHPGALSARVEEYGGYLQNAFF